MASRRTRCWVAVAAVVGATGGCSDSGSKRSAGGEDAGTTVLPPRDIHALLFTRTAGFRHASIEDARAFFESAVQDDPHLRVTATEDASVFTDAGLDGFDVVMFVNTTGDVLDDPQQEALQRFVRSGRGFVGVHSAADTEHDWPWYGKLVGAYFTSHPLLPLEATLATEDREHATTEHLEPTWTLTDEWYNFDRNPRHDHHVLLTVDEAAFYREDGSPWPTAPPGGAFMGADHPVAWVKEFEGGRSFYTNLGHQPDTWRDARFRAHLLAGIRWASEPIAYNRIVISQKAGNPLALRAAPDGRVVYVERTGEVYAWNPRTGRVTLALKLDVDTTEENGLLGIALDPSFADTRRVYLYHSAPIAEPPPAGPPGRNVVSRFVLRDDDTLDPASREDVFEVPSERKCCHEAGYLEFLPDGTLLLTTGDNTNPHESGGANPIDGRPGRDTFDARRTAANADDLRGKILRINADGSAPETGNLFSSGGGRAEIFAMGVRNPFRVAADPATGRVYWGDVGPDAALDSPRGPRGFDEINLADSPGDYGWPFCIAENLAYPNFDFATEQPGAPFSCDGKRPALVAYDYLTANHRALGNAMNPEAGSVAPIGTGLTGRTALAGAVYRAPAGAAFSFPAALEGRLLMLDWTRDIVASVELRDDGTLRRLRRELPFIDFRRPIDLDVGPDGALYVAEFGTQYGGDNVDAKITRIEHSPTGELTPVAHATASPTAGNGPLTVTLSAAGSHARGRREAIAAYEWDFEGDGTVDATSARVEHTFTTGGVHYPSLVVVGTSGRRSFPTVTEVIVGNTPPTVTIRAPRNGALYTENESVALVGEVTDAEDVTIDCNDLVWDVRQGHNSHSHPARTLRGCSPSFAAGLGGHSSAESGLFYVVELVYTDRGGPNGEPPLTSRSLIKLFVRARP